LPDNVVQTVNEQKYSSLSEGIHIDFMNIIIIMLFQLAIKIRLHGLI